MDKENFGLPCLILYPNRYPTSLLQQANLTCIMSWVIRKKCCYFCRQSQIRDDIDKKIQFAVDDHFCIDKINMILVE